MVLGDSSDPASFLLTHFDRLAEAPGGLAKLRALILQLAVTGKLLPQSRADESAAKLLARIRTGKARFTKRPTPTAPIDRSEVEVSIPAEWEWIKLGDLCSKTGSGSTPRGGKTAYISSGIPFLRSQNVYDDGLKLDGVAYITPEIHAQMSGTAVVAGDLLLNITGGSIGRCAIVPESFTEGNVSQHVAILRPAVAGMSGYLHLVILSPHFQKVMLGSQTGAGREGLPKNRMDEILIPLPPLAEQRRIVAKVEELMGLCDALEAAQREREAVRARLRTSVLHQLASANTASNSATTFFLKHAPLLSAAPEDILSIRQSVLQLAIQGKLTDSPLRYPRVDHESKDIPFFIPVSWNWGTIRDICENSFYGPRFGKDEYTDVGIPTIRTTDMTDAGRIALKNPPRVLVEDPERIEAFKCRKGDLLVTRTGSIGIMAIFDGDYLAIPSAYLIRFRFKALAAPEFVHLLLRSPYGFSQLGLGTTKVAQPNINSETIKSIPIPLPPLAVQRRIVANVDELMAVLDALEATVTTARTTAERLLAATIAKLNAA